MSRDIVVTGAAGFIGRWVVRELLDRGHTVRGVDNFSNGSQRNIAEFDATDQFELVEGDVRDAETIDAVFDDDIDACIHLAAEIDVQESLEDPQSHFESNVIGTQKILEACRRTDTRIGLVGTCMVYDMAASESGISETHPVKPASPYAGSKLATENLAESYYHGYDLPVVILRPFNTYGPFQKTGMAGGVVSIFTSRDLDGEPLKIFGDGTQSRDLLYATDCARFIVEGTFCEDATGEVLNAGTGSDISVNDLAELIATGDTEITHVEHHHPQSEVQTLRCDPSKSKAMLGWEPEVSLEEGVDRLRSWLREKPRDVAMSDELPAQYGGEPIRTEVLGYGSQSISDHETEAVTEALAGDYITRGPTVEAFEQRVAELVGVDHAIATTSGTTALHLAGDAAGFGPGDEVITTPLTFASTAYAATYNDATPVFADIDPHRRTLDPDAVRQQITDDTVGLVPMHYAGHPADIEGLLEVADDHDLTVIWDACHAFGGTWREEPIGAQRDMAMFSFHPVKNITTGEGGMVVTDDDDLAERLRRLRSFDMNYAPEGHEDEPWYQVTEGEGYNYNVTDLQAALGLAQMDRLDEFKQRRDEIIAQYDTAFAEIDGIRTPPEPVESDPMYHLYAVEIDEAFGCGRTEFVNAMHAENIGVQVHYVPLYYHPYFQQFGFEPGAFPETEAVYDGLVSLPLHAEMKDTDVDDVITGIQKLSSYHHQ